MRGSKLAVLTSLLMLILSEAACSHPEADAPREADGPGWQGAKWEYFAEGWPDDARLAVLGDRGWELRVVVVKSEQSAASAANPSGVEVASGEGHPRAAGGGMDVHHRPTTQYFFVRQR